MSCTSSEDISIPTYGALLSKPGLYLGLFHGRIDPKQEMAGWGFDGPAIGPLRWCHTTYASEIKLDFNDEEDAKKYFNDTDHLMLRIVADMVHYDGKYYGDWTVYYVDWDECALPDDSFRRSPRRCEPILKHRTSLK